MFKLFKIIKVIGQRIGDFAVRVILTLFYFVVFAPFALWMRARRSSYARTAQASKSFWGRRTISNPTLENARRGY